MADTSDAKQPNLRDWQHIQAITKQTLQTRTITACRKALGIARHTTQVRL